MQGIYTYIPETNCVPRECSVAAILLLLFMVLISLVLLLSSSSSSPLCRVFILIFLRQTILLLLFLVLISLVSVLNLLYFYTSTFRSMCAVPNMAGFCSSLTSCFPGMLLTYFLNDFEIVPVAPIITGITFVFTFHMRYISFVRSLYFLIFSVFIIIIIRTYSSRNCPLYSDLLSLKTDFLLPVTFLLHSVSP